MEQQAPEIIFTVLLGGTLIIWIGIFLFSKNALRKELQATTLELATMIAVGATFGSLTFPRFETLFRVNIVGINELQCTR